MLRISFVVLILFFYSFLLCSQNDNKAVNDIPSEDSTVFVNLKLEFSRLINPNPDSAYIKLQEYRKHADNIGYPKGDVDADYLSGSYFRRTQNSDSAIFYFKKAIEGSNRLDLDDGRAIGFNGLCHVYSKLGEMKLASSACESCVIYSKKIARPDIEAASYLAISQVHMRQNELKKALSFNLKIDSIHQVAPVRPVIIAGAYQNIGDVYMGLSEYDKAEKYFLKSNATYKDMPQDMTYYLKHTEWYLGQLYFKRGDFEKAKNYLEGCHEYFTKIQDNHTIAEISKTLGLLYIKTNQESKGSDKLQQAYDLQAEFGNRNEMAYIGIELGKVYIDRNEADRAVAVLKTSLADVPRLNNSNLMQEANLKLGQAYNLKGDYENAYRYLQAGMKIKDSLQLIQNAGQIRELEALYQEEKSEREITYLKSQNQLAEQEKKNQRNILLGGIGVTSIASLFFFFLFRNRQKTNQKLKEIDNAKSAFFTNISHEFRTPLTLIKGPVQEQLNRTDIPNETRMKFEMIDRNSDRLLNLVDQTLNISKIESGGLSLKVSSGEINVFIGTLADAYSYMADEKRITFSKEIAHAEDATWFDKDVVEKVVTNLLNNAIKYTPLQGNISVASKVESDLLLLEVKNDGPGIDKNSLNKIFDRFYQVNQGADGVGVGLSLVKNLVTLHKGEISAESEIDGWTIFTVKIPVSKNAFKTNELVVDRKIDSLTSETENTNKIKDTEPSGSDKPIMLIVEDNEDVRLFVKNIFKEKYNILEAENGEIGIGMAVESVPDIIVSDVMMPIVDGVELSQSLKKNQCTSHIPIILLTAKAGDENELIGIKSGADDYITKPFNVDLLKTKIDNLLETRRVLRSKYSNELFVSPKVIAVTSADEELLTKIRTIMDDKISDGKFNVAEFSSLLGMSRMQLHRKLKSLTGLSTTEFIRSQRIIMAAQILKSSDLNVSEVGYSVGFNDHAYFSKCFKEVYKCSPSEYASR